MASEIRLARAKEGQEIEIREQTLERQCDHEYIDQVRPFVGEYEVILSMACGAGIQYVAEKYRTKPVLPAVNTTFLGVTREQGVWSERCQGCGECILHLTGGICPVARCSKRLLNGPCGGSTRGKCEINAEVDCAWQLIWDRLKALGLEKRYGDIMPAKDWQNQPRRRAQTNHQRGSRIMKTESVLEKILAAGHLAVTSECGPPRGAVPEKVKEKAEKLLTVVMDILI